MTLTLRHGEAREGETQITDERAWWINATRQPRPILAEDFRVIPATREPLALVTRSDSPIVVVPGQGWERYPADTAHGTIVVYAIGSVGMLAPLEVRVHDPIGLSSPLAAHATPLPDGAPGTTSGSPRTGTSPTPVSAGPRGGPGLPGNPGDARLGPRTAHLATVLGQLRGLVRPDIPALRR